MPSVRRSRRVAAELKVRTWKVEVFLVVGGLIKPVNDICMKVALTICAGVAFIV